MASSNKRRSEVEAKSDGIRGSFRARPYRARPVLRATALFAALSIAGCATTGGGPGSFNQSVKNTFSSDDPCSDNARNIGLVLGTVIGGVLGKQIGDGKAGVVLGAAAAGAMVGGFIGADMDRKRCELSKIAKQYQLDMTFEKVELPAVAPSSVAATPDAGQAAQPVQVMSMSLRDPRGDAGQFELNSAVMTPRAVEYFTAIAAQYADEKLSANATATQRQEWAARSRGRRLLLVGHTDDTGSSQLNAELSERRAKAVGDFLRERGVSGNQIYFQGAGEGYPVASNSEETGRALNRRVEFVEVNGDENLQRFIEARRANYSFYRAPDQAANVPAPAPAPVSAAPTARAQQEARVASTSRAVKSAAEPAKSTSESARKPTTPAPSAAEPAVRATGPVAAASANKLAARSSPMIDFGGTPLTATSKLVDLGKPASSSTGFALISEARADVPVIARCDQDRPRVIGGVKALDSGKQYRTNEHLPGLYGTTWFDKINGNLVVINHLAVLRDGSTPSLPELKFYANYDDKNPNVAPNWAGRPAVNVYQGGNGLLYRVFVGEGNAARCLDILFPVGGGFTARDGKVVYGTIDAPYVADFKPQSAQ